jgi:hypothetical protein
MNIQVQFNNGNTQYCSCIKEIFIYLNNNNILKISFDNPKTNKIVRLLYNNDKNIWIQTPIGYNTYIYSNYKELSDIDYKVIKNIINMNNLYEAYQEYTIENLINFLSSF